MIIRNIKKICKNFASALLIEAIKHNELLYVKIAIFLGADYKWPIRCGLGGSTPLTYSAWSGYTKLVKYLIKKGADIEMRGDSGLTPLYYAIYFKRVAVVKELLNNGADKYGCKDKNGMTPLDWAVYNDSKEILELLGLAETKGKPN